MSWMNGAETQMDMSQVEKSQQCVAGTITVLTHTTKCSRDILQRYEDRQTQGNLWLQYDFSTSSCCSDMPL